MRAAGEHNASVVGDPAVTSLPACPAAFLRGPAGDFGVGRLEAMRRVCPERPQSAAENDTDGAH